ncbi:hypothetical protein D5086_009384 [Populus alba]
MKESPASQPQDQEYQTLKDTPFSGQQSRILSPTLDEIQLKRGKSFGSMNMDEFLAKLWNSDDNSEFLMLSLQMILVEAIKHWEGDSIRGFLNKSGCSSRSSCRILTTKKVTTILDSNNSCLDMNFGIGLVVGLGYQNAGNNLSAGNGFTTYHMFPLVKG